MDDELVPLTDVLARLPWFRDLSRPHRTQMLDEVAGGLAAASADELTALLDQYAELAHSDLKWARLHLLRESGLLEPPQAA